MDLMDARKKSISGSLDENPELKSKWEKVFYQRVLAMGQSMIDDNNFLLRIIIMIKKEGELRPRNQVIPSMRRGSTSTGSRGASWRKDKLGNDKLGKDYDDNSAEESSDKTPLTVRNIQVLVLLLITR